MTRATDPRPADLADMPGGPPTARTIGGGDGWQISEFVCRLGPRDKPFEERHEQVSIAVVAEGTFRYRTAAGDALLYPGALLLGNPGTCFECGHDHGVGDRCIAFSFEPDYFAEIAATVTGSHRFRFPAAMLPAGRALTVPVVTAESAAAGAGPLAQDELAVGLAETVLGILAGASAAHAPRPSARDHKRIGAVLRHIEAAADQPLDLAGLAGVAAMSKYHFLRTFRRLVGVTPHQFVIGLRMRRAALRLRTTALAVGAIAFDAGFGDLSTFNNQFRARFGAPPGAFRRSPLPPRRPGPAKG